MTASLSPRDSFDSAVSNSADCNSAALKNSTKDLSSDESFHASAFQRCLDDIPGAIAQVITTSYGQVIAYPYISAGCYKLLEAPIPPVSASASASPRARIVRCLFEAIHPEDRDRFELAMSRAAKEPRLWTWEGRILSPNGKVKWIVLTIQPGNKQPDPKTILWHTLAQDVTDRKQAELETKQLNQLLSSRLEARTAELAISQNRLQKLADNVPDLLYEMRLNSQSHISFPYVSSASQSLLSLSPEEFQRQGVAILALVHADEQQGLKEVIRESALTMRVYHYECRVKLPSGKLRWVRTVAKPQPQEDGSVIWYGCLSDISDRKQIETCLSRSLKELTDVKFALDCAAMVIITDHRGRITYVNEQFCKTSEYNRAELIGQTPSIINSKCHSDEFFKTLWQTISQGHVWRGEICNRNKSGNLYWVETTIVPFLDDSGCPYQYVAIRHEITERKQAHMRLTQQAQDLENALTELQQAQTQLIQTEKMSSLGQLVAGVAHEINNPVGFIYGNINPASRYATSLIDLLNLYQHHYPDPPEEILDELEDLDFNFITEDLINLLRSMKIGAERIRTIVTSLRTFSRKDEAEKKTADIHQGLDSTLMILGHRLKAQPERAAIEVVKNYGILPAVMCYPGQLNQVFMNILSNAIDALEESLEPDVTPQINISTDLSADQIVIKIEDNGIGMPENVRSQIFNPFFTTKPVGQGTGMGLSISYQIVTERHGGSLLCESAPKTGTTFIIQIPQQPSQ